MVVNPVGIVTTAAIVVAPSVYRWIGLRRIGQFDVRSEWPFWLFGLGMIGVSVVLTVAGRVAMLAATPFILIPAGVYMLHRSTVAKTEFGIEWRRTGWTTIATGVLASVAALGALVITRVNPTVEVDTARWT
jgi:uncharacterized membrane protein YfcA